MFDGPLTISSTGSEHSGTPRSSLASSGRDSSTAMAVKETLAKQIGPTKNATQSYKRDSKGEADEFKAGEPCGKRRRRAHAHTSRGVYRPTKQQRVPVQCGAATGTCSTSSKLPKIAVDPTLLQATSAFLPIPSTDVSPVVYDEISILQDTKVASTDDDEENRLLSFKIEVNFLKRWNAHIKSNILRHPQQRRLDNVGDRMTIFQAVARGHLLRTKPWIREFKKSIRPALRAPEPIIEVDPTAEPAVLVTNVRTEDDNDRALHMSREIKSREEVNVMQKEIDFYKKKLEAAEAETSAAENRIRKLEQMITQAFPQLVVEHHPFGGEPARSSKENRIQPSSGMLTPNKASGNGPPRSRSRSPLPASGHASLRQDKRTVLGPAM
ncbi:hypothetical protein BC936DRAFT_145914 [Jimgerdemannia flammicorona]|uniref:Uncharacterized protein n=1 Tax=Jimgerdemannia flammicorona TaxID=994334 RepID=A0A433D8U6_9FUNG|nr:hypothetical protein BC936DRAFT_145914 [Jimgerdemannia flammicorona]